MLFQRIIMFKVMNAVRVDTGEVNTQEKRRLCHLRLRLGCSVAAIHSHHFHSSQHNEPETSKRGLRGRERERREGGREGDQSVKKTAEGKDRHQNTCFGGNVWRYYSGIFAAIVRDWTLNAPLSLVTASKLF